jgi:hypothetical protein
MKTKFLSLFTLVSSFAFAGAAAIFDGSTVRLQKPTLKIPESGSGGQVFNLAIPSLAADYTLTFPVDDGTSGQVLTTNGSGTLTWETPSAAANSSDMCQAYYATTASCSWQVTTPTSWSDFPTNSSCPAPTVEVPCTIGTISTTDADLPQITVTGLTAGKYKVTVSLFEGYSGTGGNIIGYRISDGTTAGGNSMHILSGGVDEVYQHVVVMAFTYATGGTFSKTFKIQAIATNGNMFVVNNTNDKRTTFTIERYAN